MTTYHRENIPGKDPYYSDFIGFTIQIEGLLVQRFSLF